MNLAKLFPPQPSHVLDRERLIARLKSWEDRKLVIIHAQAGQGKSTLAADYVRSLRSPSIWYNMDPEDDNPAVFLSCLGHACNAPSPAGAGAPALPVNRLGVGSSSAALPDGSTRSSENFRSHLDRLRRIQQHFVTGTLSLMKVFRNHAASHPVHAPLPHPAGD
jgi:hypothetical protein